MPSTASRSPGKLMRRPYCVRVEKVGSGFPSLRHLQATTMSLRASEPAPWLPRPLQSTKGWQTSRSSRCASGRSSRDAVFVGRIARALVSVVSLGFDCAECAYPVSQAGRSPANLKQSGAASRNRQSTPPRAQLPEVDSLTPTISGAARRGVSGSG